ncbi:MAG: hypothetical protein KDI61_02960 [Alphaproteobacteria bacterium]|nr:hypothetical protein [Alphaproteobacteria bacterium]MCB1839211.1 hypothetical protein [Alphaproteobacteria bacterium]
MANGIYDPEGETLRLRLMLKQGFMPNADGSVTPLSPEVSERMLQDIEAGSHPFVSDDEDGLSYETPGL